MISAIIAISGNDPDRVVNFHELIKCIRRQDYRDYEVVVVEQYTDVTFYHDAITNLPAVKYKAIKGEPFSLSWCRNVGARISSGDILLFLDADAVFGETYFSQISKEFKGDYCLGWNYAVLLSREGKEAYLQDQQYKAHWPRHLREVIYGPADSDPDSSGLVVILDRDFYLSKIGGFHENCTNYGFEDDDIMLRAKAASSGPWNALNYTMIHLKHGHKDCVGKQNAQTFYLSRRYPSQMSRRLVGARLGNFERQTTINLAGLRSHVRPMISFLRDVYGDKPVIGAEIGVYEGESASCMLAMLNLRKLYLIDPYVSYDGYQDPMNDSNVLRRAKDVAARRLREHADVIQWICLRSDEAVDKIEDDLDFVYIDGNHDYEHVKQDIINYYPLVKPFGYVGGHDYVMKLRHHYSHWNPVCRHHWMDIMYPSGTCVLEVKEVKKAVDEFIREYGYNLTISYSNGPDWWIQK